MLLKWQQSIGRSWWKGEENHRTTDWKRSALLKFNIRTCTNRIIIFLWMLTLKVSEESITFSIFYYSFETHFFFIKLGRLSILFPLPIITYVCIAKHFISIKRELKFNNVSALPVLHFRLRLCNFIFLLELLIEISWILLVKWFFQKPWII